MRWVVDQQNDYDMILLSNTFVDFKAQEIPLYYAVLQVISYLKPGIRTEIQSYLLNTYLKSVQFCSEVRPNNGQFGNMSKLVI